MTGTAFFFLGIFVLFIFCAILTLSLILYNIIVRREEGVNAAWARIGVYMQQKSDMIPALMNVVEAYAGHEKSSIERIVSARHAADKKLSQIDGSDTVNQDAVEKMEDIAQVIEKGMYHIRALAEAYPDLKADQNYIALQNSIVQTENSIAGAKQILNNKVKQFNTCIRQFPFNILASVGNFKSKQYLQTERHL